MLIVCKKIRRRTNGTDGKRNKRGARVADRYQRRADVLNRGYSGYNTDWFLRHAATPSGKADLLSHDDVRLVTVFFGANDASHPELNERQHVPLEAYKSNLRKIVSLIRANFGAGASVVIISPPPVCHEGRLRFQRERYGEGATGKLERTLELSGRYARGAGDVASELDLPFLDLWNGMQFTSPGVERKDWRGFLSDGLHFSPSGNKFAGDCLLELIDEMLPDLAVRPCPASGLINSGSACSEIERSGPWHDEIDHRHPDGAFK